MLIGNYIFHKDKMGIDILQKFTPPNTDYNSLAFVFVFMLLGLIEVVWTPILFKAEKRTNIHKLDDPKIPFYDRITTYEGPPHFSKKGKEIEDFG
jgi:hypothetical protein